MTEIGMLRFVFTRLALVVPTFIGITLLVFVLIRLIPGDPIETMAGERGIDPTGAGTIRPLSIAAGAW
jgi:dipeptide transport system permease protein